MVYLKCVVQQYSISTVLVQCSTVLVQCSIFTWSVLVSLFTHKPPGSNHLHVQTLLPVNHPDLDVT